MKHGIGRYTLVHEQIEFAIDIQQWMIGGNFYRGYRFKTWNLFFLCFRLTYFKNEE